jgi:hypothetical protein
MPSRRENEMPRNALTIVVRFAADRMVLHAAESAR